MINFDAVDFSERRSEEVISLFWCSVYYLFAENEWFRPPHDVVEREGFQTWYVEFSWIHLM